MDVDGGVVIARDLIAVPPTGLDTLRLTHQTQRAPPPGQPVPHGQPLRRREEPHGPAPGRCDIRAAPGLCAMC